MNSLCLATNYLLMTPANRQMWIDFDRHLEDFGARLTLLSSTASDEPLPFPIISIPFLLRDYATSFPGACRNGYISAADWELLRVDSFRSNNAYPPGEGIAGLFACRKFLSSILETLQPGYVLTWDPTSPMAQILQALAREAGLPVQGLERGLLPETLMIESRGIQGYSDLRTHWLAQDIPASASKPEKFERIRDYYLSTKPQKYAQPEFGQGGAALRESLGLKGKKVIVFLGHYDACGLVPKNSNQRRYNSPVYDSTADALTAVGDILAQDASVAVVFKPHPIDSVPYVLANVQGIRVVRDVNVHALIDLADVVVAQFTTLQFEAALYEKPVVLLARSAWWGRNAAYEVNSKAELIPALQAALARKNWPIHSANARSFLAWTMEHFHIGRTATVPARRDLRDFAKFVATTSLDSRHLPPATERWEQVEHALNQLRQPAHKTFGQNAPFELAFA
ncbi:MAG TPA: hypothetical protein VN873_08935 [Candidatus Angelobacter sp.]|nr:hypothetical protein [Candidatus Angelobacter sp.]